MGTVLFLAVPFVSGFAIGLITRPWQMVAAVLALNFLITMIILLCTRLEGLLCVVLSMPLLTMYMMLGAGCGILSRVFVIDKLPYGRRLKVIVLFLLPALLKGADALEQPIKKRVESVESSISLDAPPERIWQEIKSIDKITASRPWLMQIGLYEPVSCTLSEERVGASRICYFKSGAIYETIEEWKPPHLMKMRIDRSTLPGRPWLDYIDASYELTSVPEGTLLKRKTTITSRLRPSWYWGFFERMGVEAEHGYIFAEIAKRSSRLN